MRGDEYTKAVELQGSFTSRIVSPALEWAAANGIETTMRSLIEGAFFYQKREVDLEAVDTVVIEAISDAIQEWQKSKGTGPDAKQKGIFAPKAATPEYLASLRQEIARRPWEIVTRHLGDDPNLRQIHRVGRTGSQPLGTADEDMYLRFYLPSVQLNCSRCKATRTFIALVSSARFAIETPYPRMAASGREQIFTPLYRCETCREILFTFLIRRVGLRLHLCGSAPRRDITVSQTLPAQLKPILSDAEQAIAEGDCHAAFYHLRTLIEHYLKGRLGIPISQQVRGEDLVSQHYSQLKPDIGSVLPSLTTAYSQLSDWLHARTGTADGYRPQRDAVCKHIQALALLSPDS